MIEQVKGCLIEKSPTFIVVDVNGIGYGINVSAHTAGKLPEVGDGNTLVTIYTNLVVREDSMTLFGFADKTEKDTFLMLLDVNGVGPKMAQRILSGVTPADLLNMIASDNKSALSKIKGLGKKTCEQMVLTLRDKAGTMLQGLGNVEGSGVTSMGALTGAKLEAVLALHTLGVKDPAAEKAVVKAVEVLGDSADAAQLIPEALKYL
ncbi:Holliday junction DNA helicase subunit RuvA [Fibrobacter sp. UWH9]|uniref:Holliday junction branch migration protein RuvA n=1 Tax=unclassified Fibrobacter TaxID=2634177 RepID=UPI00091CE506|nr:MULTISPECIES: Holliday junction branch migration protein RuvA [Fibrobacter]MCQ2099621.1 Holliday junction branch migration protein RuvA [Fibrobacter sp.]MCL4101839.1 Holliday junction ATP-dependent DNA helicase RuvA [Fibrobacter succinogenes]MDO4947232.1 Holliday junction branch migration protein RuvA [Fibrobacter sp.]OWV06139.1 Holliday junction branch migration protein RuvA [Fibrobacter sp. UWH3]OWV15622.1 Holliday junction branch migration protein RuvA [Fibrobacter sp. UWH1]